MDRDSIRVRNRETLVFEVPLVRLSGAMKKEQVGRLLGDGSQKINEKVTQMAVA